VRDHGHAKGHHGDSALGHVIHWAPLYEGVFGRLLRRTHGAIVELAGPRAGERALDVGCGTGSLAVALKRAVGPTGSVHGIDPSPEMIEVARRNASKAGLGVDFQIAPGQALPFAAGTFDLVVSQLAVHHVPAELRPAAFGEMRRVLKPGGRCLIVDFEPPAPGLWRLAGRLVLGAEMMQMNVVNYRPLLEGAGFKDVEAGRTRYRLLSFVRGRVAR